jgi:hypothetical protein
MSRAERNKLADKLRVIREDVDTAIKILLKSRPTDQDLANGEEDLSSAIDRLKDVWSRWPGEHPE